MKRKDVVTGLLLIGIGVIFLASNLGAMPEVNVARMWPLILVVIGVGRLLSSDEGWFSGASIILIGGIFLAHNYRVMRIHDSWPLFIVVAGLSVLFGAERNKVEGKKS